MKQLIFERAHITAIEHKIANASVTSSIKVTAAFNSKVADALEARWVLFDKDSVPKTGYKAVDLDAEIPNIRVKFEVPKLDNHHLELTSEKASCFKIFRSGDPKKRSSKLMVRFRIHHNGSPFELLEYMLRIAGEFGCLTIIPMQKELFEAPPAANSKKKAPVRVQVQ